MYAVVFSSTLSADSGDYAAAAAEMVELSREQPGFVGIDSARDTEGHGITVCLWESLEAIDAWREHVEHRAAQSEGAARWYDSYRVMVCEVLRDRSHPH